MDSAAKGMLCVPAAGATLSGEILENGIVGGYVTARFRKLLKEVLDDSLDPAIALPQANTLLLYAWQELNTGKWSDVDINWHKLYAAASWMKAVSTARCRPGDPEVWSEVIRFCDMGHLMGGDVWDNILIRTISNVEKSGLIAVSATAVNEPDLSEPEPKRRKLSSPSHIPIIRHPIPTAVVPSLTDFMQCFLKSNTPVVIKGCLDIWPALRKWSPEYVRKVCGSRTVPVELGKRYTDEDWGQQLMSISAFIDKYIFMIGNPERKIAYLAQHDLFTQAPMLRDDVSVPDYIAFCSEDDPDLNAWFGPEGTISPLHHDPKHNFLCQVIGNKYIRLYGETETEKVYPHESAMLFNTSQVDVENPDHEKFPKFSDAVFQEHILEAGDMLYIPPRCWHYVRSLSISFSVSFWFNNYFGEDGTCSTTSP